MPSSALASVAVDHCLPAGKIGEMLVSLTHDLPPEPPPIPKDLAIEAKFMEDTMNSSSKELQELSQGKAVYGCPDCGGPLQEIGSVDGLSRYRCRVGHAFTDESLLAGQNEGVEAALWAAIRTFEEQATVLARLTEKSKQSGSLAMEIYYETRSVKAQQDARILREFIVANHSDEENQGRDCKRDLSTSLAYDR